MCDDWSPESSKHDLQFANTKQSKPKQSFRGPEDRNGNDHVTTLDYEDDEEEDDAVDDKKLRRAAGRQGFLQ